MPLVLDVARQSSAASVVVVGACLDLHVDLPEILLLVLLQKCLPVDLQDLALPS